MPNTLEPTDKELMNLFPEDSPAQVLYLNGKLDHENI